MSTMKAVRPERTGWRDEALSRRHRAYGFDCPAADVDFVLIEFDRAEPAALIEYKAFPAQWSPQSAGITAIRRLAERAQLPFFVAIYWTEPFAYEVHPANARALALLGELRHMSEQEYVRFLYRLRGRWIQQEILNGLDNERPVVYGGSAAG